MYSDLKFKGDSQMAWDNIISRGSWLIFQPSNFLIILLIFSALAIVFFDNNSLSRKIATKINLATLLIISVISFTNFSSWIMWPLEARFSQYKSISIEQNYSGIIVLAGSERTTISTYVNQATFSNAGERLYQTVNVAKKFPNLPIIHTGGGRKNNKEWSENDVAKRFFEVNDINLARIRFDDKSYNTYTNAIESQKLFHASENKKWLLVTSAFHMPRAVGAFQKVGVKIHPYPVDYRTPLRYNSFFRLSMSENFRIFDLAVHEYLGLIAYYITGRSQSLFPTIE